MRQRNDQGKVSGRKGRRERERKREREEEEKEKHRLKLIAFVALAIPGGPPAASGNATG